ncbi:hypothetical protein BGZ65_000273, partial [Modicella reniformis]
MAEISSFNTQEIPSYNRMYHGYDYQYREQPPILSFDTASIDNNIIDDDDDNDHGSSSNHDGQGNEIKTVHINTPPPRRRGSTGTNNASVPPPAAAAAAATAASAATGIIGGGGLLLASDHSSRRRSSLGRWWSGITRRKDDHEDNSLSRISTMASTATAPAGGYRTYNYRHPRRRSSLGGLFTSNNQPNEDKLGRRRSLALPSTEHKTIAQDDEHKGLVMTV